MFNKEYKSLLQDSFFDDINGCSLDNSQRKVVLDESDNLLVIAGAGSGKTLTIIGKIKYLIEKRKINYQDILCISFTNETVNNLKKKIGYDIDCYTFHKLSLRILKEGNYPYTIVSSDTLEYLVDEYFESFIYRNGYLIYLEKYFAYLLKKIVTFKEITTIYYKQFFLFKRMIVSFINRIKCNNHNYLDILDYLIKNKRYDKKIQDKNKCFLIIVFDIYKLYLEEIDGYLGIDFDLMISESIKVLKEKGMYHNYKYIIIDEFQDTSLVRYELIKTMQDITKAKIMCVGDDYQSIYAFSGCNLDLFVNFKNYFHKSRILYINKTYRNSYELVNISCKFVSRNHYQMKKVIKANFLLKKPIKIIYYDNDYQEKFYQLLDYLINQNKKHILVLGRNNNDINNLVPNINGNSFIYHDVLIKYLTVHRSKGLEEENVILINANDDYLGFPNKIIDDQVFELISKNKEKILFPEERRLFYVALTRTKEYCFIMAKRDRVSKFVLEIVNKIEELDI